MSGGSDSGVWGQMANDPATLLSLASLVVPNVTYNNPVTGVHNTIAKPGQLLAGLAGSYDVTRSDQARAKMAGDIASQMEKAKQGANAPGPYGYGTAQAYTAFPEQMNEKQWQPSLAEQA